MKPKSLGQVAYEAYYKDLITSVESWGECRLMEQHDWNMAARAAVRAYRARAARKGRGK